MSASCSPARVVASANTFLVDADLQALGAACVTDEREPFEVVDYVAM